MFVNIRSRFWFLFQAFGVSFAVVFHLCNVFEALVVDSMQFARSCIMSDLAVIETSTFYSPSRHIFIMDLSQSITDMH